MIIWISLGIPLCYWIYKSLPKCSDVNNESRRLPLSLRIMGILVWVGHLSYKVAGYHGSAWFLLMPCNVAWIIMAILILFPDLNPNVTNILIQHIVNYTGMYLSAILMPDTSGLNLPYEVQFFFLNHYALLVYPIYYVISGKAVLLLPTKSLMVQVTNFLKWSIFSSLCFNIFYFVLIPPLCIWSALNIGYSMKPPPGLFYGIHYRWKYAIFWTGVIITKRLIFVIIQLCIQRVTSSSSRGKRIHSE